ncbi:Methyl-CpG-binding domain-containing protein 9 [Vitis vinifera]|uniref:Methyl-CpG-binding domain-containing protein 9 n=1 Tax=Vitis vinifera TaxID=29760 RepID=A0A438EHK0_VITVI|nr:Methyl-CpG-binding domain-containing protein 9 [Vitis vinifera]
MVGMWNLFIVESEAIPTFAVFCCLDWNRSRNESSNLSRSSYFKHSQENFRTSFNAEILSGREVDDFQHYKFRNNLRVTAAEPEEMGGCDFQYANNEFPVQFEDFYILSLGKIDSRPSYHNSSLIWPVGYKSSWHDKITGSFFVCDVLDDGDSGPVFKSSSQTESNCRLLQSSGKLVLSNLRVEDNIGEFLVEASSSSSAWSKVSQTVVHACCEAYKQTGVLQFCCKHDLDQIWTPYATLNADAAASIGSLAKFCNFCGPINIPCCIQNDSVLDTSCDALIKWLDQDRFGLDVEFVQEIIEHLPGVHACSEYEFLNRRTHNSTPQTFRSGFLLAKRKSEVQGGEKAGNLFKCKRPRKQVVESPVIRDCCPPGKPLSLTLPADLIGDVLQIWESLWRFSEVLGLEEPISFEELKRNFWTHA